MDSNDKLGHASAQEIADILRLSEAAAAGELDIDDTLHLALRLFEPAHEPFAAIDLLREVLRRDASFDLARIWLGYLNVYEAMDADALREAISLADEVSSVDASIRAAALLVKGTALRHQNAFVEASRELRKSVEIASGWVANRLALGDVYRELGRKTDAIDQYRTALDNVGNQIKLSAPSSERDYFEAYFVGRGDSEMLRKVIAEQIEATGR